MLEEGLSAYSADVLCRCHRESTIRQYQGVWSKFLSFLELGDIRHHKIKVKDVINFLSYYSEVHPRAYKTLAVYKNALRLPLLFKLGIDIDTPLVYQYMRGLWSFLVPPVKPDRMPRWDINQLLIWLASSEFYPPESCNFYRLTQKVFLLILLASGRRVHEICALSRNFKIEGDKVRLLWPRWFRAKNHSVDHHPSDPSIRKLSHFLEGRRELRNCPVMNWKAFLARRQSRQVDSKPCLWERDQRNMASLYKTLILESQARANLSTETDIFLHHTKKLACSLSSKYWPDVKELQLEKLTGNKRFGTLSRYYIHEVPNLRVAVSIPLGTVPRLLP